MQPNLPRPLILDGGIKVLLLTALAYLAAYIQEAAYLAHFGVPMSFVDVSLRELLLCGVIVVLAMTLIIGMDTFRIPFPKGLPPRLTRMLGAFLSIIVGWSFFTVLLGAPLLMWLIPISAFVFFSVVSFLYPLIHHRQFPGFKTRLWMQYGPDSSLSTPVSKILGLPVQTSLLASVVSVLVASAFALAIGICRARIQTEFAVHERSEGCAVLRLSSDGLLCVGIDFDNRVARGTFRFIDPKGFDLQVLTIGRVAPFTSNMQFAPVASRERKPLEPTAR